MRKNLVYGYLVSVHLLLVIVLVKSDFVTRIGNRMGLINHVEPEITKHFSHMTTFHERMDANTPDGAVIFIGDSITQGLCVSAVATPSVNYGIGNDTTVGVLKRIPSYHSLERASTVVMAIGVNDLIRRGNEEILKNYSLILQAVPRRLPIIISAVLPVDERIRKDLAGKNIRIKELNSALKALCETQRPKCIFVDSGPRLIDSSGNLINKYSDDGIHLNGEGNAIWIQDLKEILTKSPTSA